MEVEDDKCRLDGFVGKVRRVKNTVASLWYHLLVVGSIINRYCQRLHLRTARFTVNDIDGPHGFLDSMSTKVTKLVDRKHRNIETTVNTDLRAIHAF